MSWHNLLLRFVATSTKPLAAGYTVLFLWRDRAHLDEWAKCSAAQSQDVRVVRVPTAMLPIFVAGDKSALALAGIGLSTAADYSDTRLLYYASFGAHCSPPIDFEQ